MIQEYHSKIFCSGTYGLNFSQSLQMVQHNIMHALFKCVLMINGNGYTIAKRCT